MRRGQFRTKAAGLYWVAKSDWKNAKIRHDTLSRAGCGASIGRFDSDEITEAPQSQIEIVQQDGMKDLSARPLLKYKLSLTLIQTDHPRLHNVAEDCIRGLTNG